MIIRHERRFDVSKVRSDILRHFPNDLYKAGKLTYVDQYEPDRPPGWGGGSSMCHPNGTPANNPLLAVVLREKAIKEDCRLTTHLRDIRDIVHIESMTETACVVCPHVFANKRPVRLLIHHSDGTWQATCGARDHSADCSDFAIVGVNHLFERQSDIAALATLGAERIAECSGGQWKVSVFDEDAAA